MSSPLTILKRLRFPFVVNFFKKLFALFKASPTNSLQDRKGATIFVSRPTSRGCNQYQRTYSNEKQPWGRVALLNPARQSACADPSGAIRLAFETGALRAARQK